LATFGKYQMNTKQYQNYQLLYWWKHFKTYTIWLHQSSLSTRNARCRIWNQKG